MKPMLIIIAFAALNRFRGGGLGAHVLPGHPRFWCAPFVFMLALWSLGDWRPALWFAAVWLFWSMQPWGDWYMMGRPAIDGRERLSAVTCWLGLSAIGLFAGLALQPILNAFPARLAAFGLALAMPVAYEIGWRWYEAAARRSEILPRIVHTQVAEPLIGAAWGLILVL